MTARDALGPGIGIGAEAAMAWAFAIIIGRTVHFACLRWFGRGGICWLTLMAI